MAQANIIRVDNGYYETMFDGRPDVFNSFNVEVFIWEGDLVSDKPVSPTLSLTVASEYQAENLRYAGYFDLGRYVQPYLDFLPKTGDYQKGVWVEYEYTRNGVVGDTPIQSITLFALLGANKYELGGTTPTGQSLFNGVVMGCNSNELTCHPDSDLLAPIYVGSDSTNAKIVTATQVIDLTTLGATLNSDDSAEQIFYLPLNATTFGSEWQEGNTIKYFVTDSDGQPYLEGIEFDGVSSYMDLGIVPMLNSQDSYVSLTYKANFGTSDAPFGYDNVPPTANDQFQMFKFPSTEQYGLLNGTPTTVDPSEYPNPTKYQEFRVFPEDYLPAPDTSTLFWTYDGQYTPTGGSGTEFIARTNSGIPFYLGARNVTGIAREFTAVVFTEAEFFNGTDLKTFNAANNWNGATNYGGIAVYSTDGGETWTTEGPQNEYCLRIKCFKGGATALRYYNCDGVLIDIPVNGRMIESATYQKKTFNNFTLDNSGGWDQTMHSNKPYQSNGREIYSVHTGWVKETINNMIKDLLLSKAVWLVYEGQETPVVIKDTQKKFINRLWEKEIGYTINLEASNEILL